MNQAKMKSFKICRHWGWKINLAFFSFLPIESLNGRTMVFRYYVYKTKIKGGCHVNSSTRKNR